MSDIVGKLGLIGLLIGLAIGIVGVVLGFGSVEGAKSVFIFGLFTIVVSALPVAAVAIVRLAKKWCRCHFDVRCQWSLIETHT